MEEKRTQQKTEDAIHALRVALSNREVESRNLIQQHDPDIYKK